MKKQSNFHRNMWFMKLHQYELVYEVTSAPCSSSTFCDRKFCLIAQSKKESDPFPWWDFFTRPHFWAGIVSEKNIFLHLPLVIS